MEATTLNSVIARRRFLWIATATALAAAAGCASTSGTRTDTVRATTSYSGGPPDRLVSAVDRAAPGNPEAARAAVAGFGADLLRRVHGAEPNTLISPYSIYSVLAMVRAGAKGETAAQLDAVLRSDDPAAPGAAVAAIDEGIALALHMANRSGQPFTLTASNEIWTADGLDVHQEFLDQLAREFGVAAVAADFVGQPEQMREAMNRWVSERTNALIPQLFPAGSIDSGTLLVLVNALYLKAPWVVPFEPAADRRFTTGTGSVVEVPMMNTGTRGVVGPAGDWTAVTIPLAGQGLQMTLLVPELGRFQSVLDGLDADLLAAASRGQQTVLLTMPPFAINSTPSVQQAVLDLGVVDLFGPADLSGIAGSPGDLVATALLHQATITVDRYGTEAAAATALMLAGSAAPEELITLLVDRPYIFWISETFTGAPLFLGAVTDPS